MRPDARSCGYCDGAGVAGMESVADAVYPRARAAQRRCLGRGGTRRFFSVAVCPACTPALVVLRAIAAGVGSPLFGVLLLLAFSVGRAVPVAVGASAIGWLETRAGLKRSQRALEIAGGLVLILSGLYILNAYFFFVPGLAN
jgi:cytochrome c biogenesis protein CcdA